VNIAEKKVLNLLHSRKVTADEAADLIDAIRAQIKVPKGRLLLSSSITGRGPLHEQLHEDTADAAALDGPVTIEGESGTGKMLVAKTIHYNSRRSEPPFLSLDCTGDRVEEELFGVESKKKGEVDKRGLLDMARGGTIVLDMVVDLSPEMQQKLYAYLQSGQFKRVRGSKTFTSDARIIGACHGNLMDRVESGQFSTELCEAMTETAIATYALRDSPESIPDLVAHFVSVQSKAESRIPPGVSDDLIAKLSAHDWKQNHSDLAQAIRAAVAGFKGDVLRVEDVDLGD
jgi:sigma-54 specific flagellar transcriptional regulator A